MPLNQIRNIGAMVLLAGLASHCAPAPPSTAAPNGGTLTLALAAEPETLNPYLAAQRAAGEVHVFVIEGLLAVNEQGNFYPVLAQAVPTKENGGISADGLTLTYHLKPGITWSDGQPFTCDDVQFTWQAVVNPTSGAVATTDYRAIDSVTCPAPLTAVVQFKKFYAAYLVPFWAVLPRHATGDPGSMLQWNYNRKPIGTGPFKITEWVSGDHITLTRNDRYRDPGKPRLASVIVRFVPSHAVALQLVQAGEVDLVGDVTPDDLAQLRQHPGIVVSSAPSPRSERLLLNLGDPSIDAANPQTQPHPILADTRVRQALELAIDKRVIVERLLNGQAAVGSNELNIGWAQCDSPPSEASPAKARQLLDEAGWRVGADGIRVAQNARFAKDGTRLRLKLQGPTGDALREQAEQLILQWWQAVGVEAYIENQPTAVLFGTWSANGVARHGRFDVLIYTTGMPIADPQSQVEGYFASWNIPAPANNGAGYNYSRWIDAAADAAITTAGATADLAARRAAYCQVMAQVNRERPQIYLYAQFAMTAYRDRLQNWRANVWKNLGWNAADWWVK